MNGLRFSGLGVFALVSAFAAAGQGGIDPLSGVVGTQKWKIDLQGAFHRGDEGRTYGSFDARYGFALGWEAALRGTSASVGRTDGRANIRSGGTDFEFQARYVLPQLAGLTLAAGFSKPNTPAQDNPFVTLGAEYQVPVEQQGFKFNAHALGALRGDDSIVGLGGSFEYGIQNGIALFGDATAIVRGNNTRDADTGDAERNALYSVGLRYNFAMDESPVSWSVFAGLTNRLGLTTGTYLSAAVGGKPSFFAGITVKMK